MVAQRGDEVDRPGAAEYADRAVAQASQHLRGGSGTDLGREALISAVIDHATEATVAALDAAALEEGPPAQALTRLLDAGSQTPEPYPFLAQLAPMSPKESHDRHRPIFDRYERLIRRGQATGDFDRQLSPAWLVAALIGLAHTAGEEIAAGRMASQAAGAALRESVLRLCGVKTAEQAPR